MDASHEVFNPPEPLSGYNLCEANQALRDVLMFNAPGPETAALGRLGAKSGSAGMQAHARLVNVHTPELHTHDRFGRRLVWDVAPALQALLLCQTSPGAVANAFCDLRLPGIGRDALAGGTDFGRIIDRAMLRQIA